MTAGIGGGGAVDTVGGEGKAWIGATGYGAGAGGVPYITPVLIDCGGIIGTAPVIEAGGGRNNLWGGGFGKALVDTETKTKLTINYIYIKSNLSNSEKSFP